MAEGFRCDVDSEYRSACKDLPKYLGSRFLGSRFCVLHYPGEDKDKEEFLNVKKSKLDRKDYDFSGTVFPEGTSDFEGREFDADASFRGATFVGSAIFYRAQFSGERTDFSRAQFSGEIAIFIAAQFSSAQTYFSEAQFSGEETDFTIAKFSSGRTKFSGATFNGQNGQPDFQDTTFRNATFENTTFQDGADFTGAKFNGTRAISNGIRERTTDFRRAIFGRELYFRGAEFKGFTDFYRTSFLDAARFIGGEREEGTSSLFAAEGQVSFKRARIDKPELFSFDTLLLRPSWFVGVDARKFDFTAVQWYGLSNGSAGTFDKAFDKEIKGIREKGETGSPYILLAQACRRLSANAEENHEYPLANEFHYWSMDAVRREGWSHFKGLTLESLAKKETRRDIRKHFGLVTTLYWALSGYGVRAGRALGVLVAMWAVFAMLYILLGPSELRVFSTAFWWLLSVLALHPAPLGPPVYTLLVPSELDLISVTSIGQGMRHIGQAIVYSLSTLARLNPNPKPNPGLFQFLVTIEGILGPLQIALLALAFRRKIMR